MIRGAIFDMDGVLLDNVSYHLEAWRQLGRERGKQLTDDEIRATFGQRNQEMLRALIGEDLSPDECRVLADRKEALYRNAIDGHLDTAMVAGLPDFLREIRGLACSAAVATSGPIENVRFVVEGLGLRDGFDAIVTSADVERGKPHPDVFLVAAERLNLRPQECVVFEDSASGVLAALRAGSFCVAVATTHSPAELAALSPHQIVSDFTGSSFQRLTQELIRKYSSL